MAGLLDYITEAAKSQYAKGVLSGLLSNPTQSLSNAYTDVKNIFNPDYMRNVQGMSAEDAKNIALDANPIMAGTFIGKGAKTWDAVNASKAIKMANKGIDERTIWEKTGTFKGADGQWRQEISDHKASVQPDGVLHRAIDKNAINEGAPTSFPQWVYMEHPEMYNAYEGTKKIAIRPTDDFNGGGSYNDAGIINISAWADNPKSTNLHELQHAIQQREGWARGGSPETMKDEALSMLRRDVASGEIPSTEQAMAMLPMAQQNAYKRLAGEAEARATQARMNLTPQERRALFPFDSYDVPRESLIVRGLL